MKLPPFSDFKNGFDHEKFAYDLKSSAGPMLFDSSDLFTQEQYTFLTQTVAAMSLTLLQQYHEWLNQQISE